MLICHCSQCRRWAGHVWAASAVPPDRLRLIRGETLRWFAASPDADRGFCASCGSSLFWRPAHGRHISFAAGALDGLTGLRIGAQWCLTDAGDYYQTEREDDP
ncbi:GFA family protein [Paracoccus sp. (in: a-proteobacteria)]|uniref:GFA family protein n=1 Tax=Paracoccus sp. TaxID=267 RepID=UPI0026DFEE4D|nr:GFA family protein [Paracoccus sp. (in: a-proteobacteria)]